MNTEQKKIFRQKMESYRFLIYRIEEMENEIEEIYRRMSGLTGISYDRIPTMPNQEAAENYKLEMIEDIAAIEKEKKIYEMKLNHLKEILDRIPEPENEMFILKYRDRKTYYQIGKLFGYSSSGIYMKMDRTLDQV